ncbi:unnamed protein product [Aphanomyces euteiches]
MSVDSSPIFHGDEGGSEAAYHWIQRFELLADTSRWNEKAKISWFASYLGKPVRAWLKQVPAAERMTWRAIKKLFVREWIKSPTSKSDKYLHMIQEPGESLKCFFYRFNSAAITANDVLDDHISKFCSALEDVALGDQLSQMSFPNIEALERYLDAQRKKIALRRLKTRYAQHALQKVQDPLRGLRPPPSKVDMDRRARERERREQQRYQVHLAVEDSDDDMAVPTPKTDNEIYTMGGKKEWCSNCDSEHYRVNGECWKDIYCPICKRNGHPLARCMKACQLCEPTHNKYEPCESREQLVQVKAYLDSLSKAGRCDVPRLDRLNC